MASIYATSRVSFSKKAIITLCATFQGDYFIKISFFQLNLGANLFFPWLLVFSYLTNALVLVLFHVIYIHLILHLLSCFLECFLFHYLLASFVSLQYCYYFRLKKRFLLFVITTYQHQQNHSRMILHNHCKRYNLIYYHFHHR